MPYRKISFENENIYHVVNRGVDDNKIFRNGKDHERFLRSIDYLRFNPPMQFSDFNKLSMDLKVKKIQTLKKNNKPLIEFLAFSLMPNHYHFLLEQVQEGGIQVFMRNFQNSYAKYFNTKYKRRGHLFQSAFKAVLIEDDEQLIHTSRYIHLNPVSSSLIKLSTLDNYPLTSLVDYLGNYTHDFINPKRILNYFDNTSSYKKFVYDQSEYQRELEKIKHE